MAAEHAQIDLLLAAVDDALAHSPSNLPAAVAGLGSALGWHLKHEEDAALPLIQSACTPADWRAFAGAMRRRQGIKGAARYVPWILDGMPPEKQRRFLAALPAPVRVVSRIVWEPAHPAQPRPTTPNRLTPGGTSQDPGWQYRLGGRLPMADAQFPEPATGFVLTHFLVVADQDRSREFYRTVFGATVVTGRDPVILQLANSWLIINVGGGPTDDKPTVTLAPPSDSEHTSAFLNIRVADIAAAYAEWSAKGAEFLTEPKVHAHEIRAYIRDPDGHLIEVGQTTHRPGAS
jgi:lactoylglutathione lyase